MKVVGYGRCSTAEQACNGVSRRTGGAASSHRALTSASERKDTARPTSGLTSVFGGTSIKGLRSAAISGLPSPPLAAILELPHSLGDLQ